MNYKFKTPPYAHQLKALEMSWNREVFAYFMEMGTGKSKVLLDNIAMLYDRGKINGVLIVAPKGVYKNWYDSEIPIHLPDHIQKKAVLWQSLIGQKQKLKLNSLFKVEMDLHILIMNVEAFSTKKGVDFATKFLASHNTLFAVDELTCFIFAVTYVRPSKSIFEVKPRSVKKKLKQKSFAASVVREDIFLSVDELGLDLTEHVQFVIDALSEKAEELGLKGEVSPS